MRKKLLSYFFLILIFQLSAILDDETILKNVTLSDHEFLKSINSSYPEMARLTEAVRASPESHAISNEYSPSKKLFGKQHIEFDRTAVGILAVKWVLANDYNQFVTGQPEAIKLKQESFNALREATIQLVQKKKLSALVTSLAFNDLGKVLSFVQSVEDRIQNQEVDHDNILLIALHKYPALVPSFCQLSNDDQQLILKGIMAQFNLGQFIQAESLPANLKGLQKLSADELEFNNLHTLYDIAGARGHVESRGACVLAEPTYQSFTMAFNALESIPSAANVQSLINSYDQYLAMRNTRLNNCSIMNPEDRAIVRLAFMTRVDNADEFNEVKTVFEKLSNTHKRISHRRA